jgi:hypothetical protein
MSGACSRCRPNGFGDRGGRRPEVSVVAAARAPGAAGRASTTARPNRQGARATAASAVSAADPAEERGDSGGGPLFGPVVVHAVGGPEDSAVPRHTPWPSVSHCAGGRQAMRSIAVRPAARSPVSSRAWPVLVRAVAVPAAPWHQAWLRPGAGFEQARVGGVVQLGAGDVGGGEPVGVGLRPDGSPHPQDSPDLRTPGRPDPRPHDLHRAGDWVTTAQLRSPGRELTLTERTETGRCPRPVHPSNEAWHDSSPGRSSADLASAPTA